MDKHLRRFLLLLSVVSSVAFSPVQAGSHDDEGHDHDHEEHAHEPHHAEHHEASTTHGAHVHGVGQLNLALEKDHLYLELNGPAANIVGFEHLPATDAQHHEVKMARQTLEEPARLFSLTPEAGCSVEALEVQSSLFESMNPHGHDDHEHHDDGAGHHHADFETRYTYHCDHPEKLTGVGVEVFTAFPATQALKVQFIIGNRQGAAELTPANPRLSF